MTTNVKIPVLKLHKGRQLAYVWVDGRFVYFGPWGRPETEEKYHRWAAEYAASGGHLRLGHDDLTVAEVLAQYVTHARDYYTQDGKPTGQQALITAALKPVYKLYASLPAKEFSPKKLKAVREQYVKAGLARVTCNRYAKLVTKCFKWATEEELLPVSVHHALATVENLKKGRTPAPETRPVIPVPEEHVEAVLKFLPGTLRAAVEFQGLTGARPSEVLQLRPKDIDTQGEIWVARPEQHKLAYRDIKREIFIGPQAQAVLRPLLLRCPVHGYLFSPQNAIRERKAQCDHPRRPGQKSTPRKTSRSIGDHYSTASYRQAIRRACEKAGVPRWTPNQLRHSAGTRVRREYGVEAAQMVLGHKKVDTTEIYAERNRTLGLEVMKEMG